MAEPLSATHPEIATQAHGWDPSTISRGSDQKLGWLCNMKHLYFATPSNRIKGSGCPYCAGKSALSGFNDMGTTHPELAAQADGWDPSQFIAGTAKKLPWKCASGHQWTVSGNSRVGQGTGCPVCSNKKIVAGINDLGSINPDLARQADGWDPSTSAPQSTKKRAWICPNDGEHRWEDSVNNRSKGRGCPYCSNHQIMVGFNDLNTTHPKVAIEACGWDPVTVVAGNRKKRLWECSVGHVWEASPVSRTRLSSGCPFCAGQRAIRGVNDLATMRPDIAAEADGWDPTEVMAQTNKKLPWTCVNDHSWITSVASRTNGTGCPTCSGNVVLAGFNDLGTTHPDIAAEANGWDPTTVGKGHITKKSWKCPMGHIYDATVNNRSKGRGCPSCAKTGFDPGEDGHLYLIRHENWGLLQIGITNNPDQRLSRHGKSGWEIIELRGPMPGDIARGWEQGILHALSRRDVRLSPEHIAGKFDGYTEAWIQEDFPADSLAALMNLVHEDES